MLRTLEIGDINLASEIAFYNSKRDTVYLFVVPLAYVNKLYRTKQPFVNITS